MQKTMARSPLFVLMYKSGKSVEKLWLQRQKGLIMELTIVRQHCTHTLLISLTRLHCVLSPFFVFIYSNCIALSGIQPQCALSLWRVSEGRRSERGCRCGPTGHVTSI